MTLEFSRRLAIVFGVLLPIVETIRRWSQLSDRDRRIGGEFAFAHAEQCAAGDSRRRSRLSA